VNYCIVSELCQMPPETPVKHRDLRGHSDAHRCCGKSLKESALVSVGALLRVKGINFQTCSIDHSDISPL
jgi:hypothetical protein